MWLMGKKALAVGIGNYFKSSFELAKIIFPTYLQL
jgi:hypothetical protein